MLKATNTLAQALVLGLISFGFASTANAASAGSGLVRPEPISLGSSDSDSSKTPTRSYLTEPGKLVRVINAGDSSDEGASANDSKAKTASKKRTTASRKSTSTSTKTASRTKRSSRKSVQVAVAETKVNSAPRRVQYSNLIRAAARKHGVPLGIAQAVVQVESNFNPRAHGSAGEVGLMQIKPATARGLGYRGSTKALYDPQTNLEWGMRYLAGAHKRAGGDVCGTILRYNAGHYAKRMNPVSSRYCQKVKQILAQG